MMLLYLAEALTREKHFREENLIAMKLYRIYIQTL